MQILQTPAGTGDLLPKEAATTANIERAVLKLLRQYGYDQVVTPTLEYLETLTTGGTSQPLDQRLFKMSDRSGRTLALRHEMTTPIARLVSTRMKSAVMPLKLSYSGVVFRREHTLPGRQCEFRQAGVELLGAASPCADAEVIALAVECLKSAGLVDFELCLGQVEFASGLMEALSLTPETIEHLKAAIESHDIVALDRQVESLSLSKSAVEALKAVPYLHGGREIIDRAYTLAFSERSRRALDNLSEIYRLLEVYGVVDKVVFDLGLIRDFSYYTGMVFEAYAPGLGYSIAGGGRYDHMLKDFGLACPATGFALGIERVMLALEQAGNAEDCLQRDVYIGYDSAAVKSAIEKAQLLRSEGKIVELALTATTEDEARESQINKGYNELIYLSN